MGNLPAELSSFVGRRPELATVKRLLDESRLVTLTGPGGTGKTRVSLRAGAELRRAFPDGVWFIDLTELRAMRLLTTNGQDPEVLASLVTATLGLREQGGGPPLQVLVEQLIDRRMLLILDNCEHLIPAIAILTYTLLQGCPHLRILTTSREPLAVGGETLFPVPPLPAPDPDHLPGLAEFGPYESVALFLARAQAVVPGFGVTTDEQIAVAELCHRLDGLPLAIELAAARVRALTPRQILDRLTDRFALLSGGSRTAPARQQTLRACMDWSFDLCGKPERILWARLSVFAGGFELDAVEGVCADEQLPEIDLLDLVAGLVDKSILVRVDPRDGRAEAARYRMLETVRDYGQEKLREAEEQAVLCARHRDWYQRLVARARAEGISDREAYWIARLRREHPNLRAAVDFCLTESGEAAAALRLLVTLPVSYWAARDMISDGRRWLEYALIQSSAPTTLRAQALLINSHLAFWQGDTATGTRLLAEGEALARHLGSAIEIARAEHIRGIGAQFANDLPTAVEAFSRAWTILSQAPDADPYLYQGVLLGFGLAAAWAGDLETAGDCQRKMLTIVATQGGGFHLSYVLYLGGLIAWRRGDPGQAAVQMAECLRHKQASGSQDRAGTARCLEVLAWITADHQQHHRRAATLLGAADRLCTDLGAPTSAYRYLVGYHNACERRLRDDLGEAAFTDAFHHGQTLTYEEAITFALQERRKPAPASQPDAATSLTRRERQVAGLIAEGFSNKDIAAKLVISPRTAESHVERILTKLGFTSRTQVAAWFAARSGKQDP